MMMLSELEPALRAMRDMFPEVDHPHALLVSDWSHLAGGVGLVSGPLPSSSSAAAAAAVGGGGRGHQEIDEWLDNDEGEVGVIDSSVVITDILNI